MLIKTILIYLIANNVTLILKIKKAILVNLFFKIHYITQLNYLYNKKNLFMCIFLNKFK